MNSDEATKDSRFYDERDPPSTKPAFCPWFRDLPVGQHKMSDGKSRRLGIRLAPADAGANFLSAEIAKVAWNACAYREPGASLKRAGSGETTFAARR
ncbi:hypothetical protein [Microbaculum sp. FT89]|uniref:hypothetical protein n=1 Tax=Microbaculum sp. FT89 TaxID=3447298 RepID=UPI003F534594